MPADVESPRSPTHVPLVRDYSVEGSAASASSIQSRKSSKTIKSEKSRKLYTNSFRKSTVNLRDVGNISPLLQKGKLYRSSQAVSTNELRPLKIKAVIDLRQKPAQCSKSENETMRFLQDRLSRLAKVPGRVLPEQLKPQALRQQPMACVFHSEGSLDEYGSDLRVFHVDTVNRSVSWTIFYAMPRFIKFKVLKAVFTCTAPEKIMAPAVACDDLFGYPKFYQTLLDSAKSEWAKAFRVLTHDSNFPALVHCIHGKDRTGLFVMMVCMLCGVDRAVVVNDYVQSENLLRAGREDGTLDLPDHLTNDEVISAKHEVMDTTIDYLCLNYESVLGYLQDIGLTAVELAKIRCNMMVAPPDEDVDLVQGLEVKHDQFPSLVLDPRKIMQESKKLFTKISSVGPSEQQQGTHHKPETVHEHGDEHEHEAFVADHKEGMPNPTKPNGLTEEA